jgi:O-antigen ligase
MNRKSRIIPNPTVTTRYKDTNKPGIQSTAIHPSTFIIILYLVAELIPQGGATDVMAPQWLYITILDLLCAFYFMFISKQKLNTAFSKIFRSTLTILYTCFFVLSGISILVAINKVESLVCYARFSATLLMFFNLALLIQMRQDVMKLLAAVLTGILAVQSLMVIVNFSRGYGAVDLNSLILSLKGTAGNKNILAASLVIKIPFLFYGLYLSTNWKKWLYVLSFTLACFAIALLNARAAYVSFISIIILYFVFLYWQNIKSWRSIFPIVIPLLLGFIISAIALSNAAAMQERDSYFGNLGQRLSSVAVDGKGSGHRLPLWRNAIDYVRHHPLIGAGYGNWKLASIPYEATITKDFEVNYHVHNDFLEAATETGIPGALLYLSVFICAGFYIYKTIINKANKEAATTAAFCLMGLCVYSIDAFFNFPGERPVMQVFFALLLAITLNGWLTTSHANEKESSTVMRIGIFFPILCILLLIPSTWLVYTTYDSMKAQFEINEDVQLEHPVKTYEEVSKVLPAVPNLNSFCMPVPIIKANYLYREKHYDQAISLIKEGQKANPYLPYDDLLFSKIYGEMNKTDSALLYARLGFEKRPKSAALYQQLNAASFRAKDTATLNQAFTTFNRYRSEAWAWNEYLNYLYDLPHDAGIMRRLVDSALRLFPGDSYLQHKKSFLEGKK